LDIIGRSLDVAVRRGADVRVTEDSLNDHVRHTEAIEIAAQPAAARVPAVTIRVRTRRARICGLSSDRIGLQACGKSHMRSAPAG